MSNVDLSALRIDESSAAVPKRPLGPRLLVAGVIAVTLAVAATFLWPLLAPPLPWSVTAWILSLIHI